MIEANPGKKPLPLFRQDLELYQGPEEPDGSPSFNIYDPVRRQYYKISWAESLIIKHLKSDMTVEDLCATLNKNTTIKVTPTDVRYFFEEAAKHNLLSLPRPSKFLIKEFETHQESLFKWLIHHYLYIRIPLVNPDQFLKRTLKYVKPFASATAFVLYILLSSVGFLLLFLHAEEFTHTFNYFFNLKGFLYYALALTSVKLIHELAHAYTAVNYNVRVPTMGICLLVMWPVMFTDVTDGWKLKNRTERLYISLAGIMVETVIAGLCTFGWAMSTSDQWKSIFFVVSTISWFSTLFLNANPMMRYDGYYILCDLWGIDNLQPRSFALARWKLRDLIFGLKLPCPEPKLSEKRIKGMVAYALCTWIYRLILYTSIAVFVYYSFTKAVGIILFFVEIGYFVLGPIISEIVVVLKLKDRVKITRKGAFLFLFSFFVFFWIAIPLPRSESYSAITVPFLEQTLYVPNDSYIQEIYVERGDRVHPGEKLFQLKSMELNKELTKTAADVELIKREIKILSLENEEIGRIPEKTRELEGLMAKEKAIQSKIAELTLVANLEGTVISLEENLRVNQSVPKDLALGKIADMSRMSVICFVSESVAPTLHVGQHVEFILRGREGIYSGKIKEINIARATKLQYPALASIYEGDLPVVERGKHELLMVDSYFPVTVVLDENPHLKYGKVGSIEVKGPKRSLITSFVKSVISVFWRESGF